MGGQPVWLASVSKRNPATDELVANEDWSRGIRAQAIAMLYAALLRVGNIERERLFRMTVTYCLHRAASDDEVASQDEYFRCLAPTGLAGGPLEILSETEVGSASTRPCTSPGRTLIDRRRPDLWVPVDCGLCAPCRARAAIAPLDLNASSESSRR